MLKLTRHLRQCNAGIICLLHFCCAANLGFCLQPTSAPALPPLKLELVLDMVTSELNSVDILVEAKSRGLGFVVGADVIKQLEERGADDLLLNWLGMYSVELRPLYASCISEQQQKRPVRVIELSTELLNRSPRLVPLYLMRGAAYRSQNQLPEAMDNFRQALKFHRNSSRTRILLAETLIQQKEIDAAITELTWVINHRSAAGIEDWPMAHRLLAAAYLERREYRLASHELHTALWQLPYPNPEAVALLPELEDHLSVLARLLALCPDSSVASPDDAIEIANLMKLLATNKDQQQVALLRLAEGQAAAGKFDEAIATQKAAEIQSTGDFTKSIHERLTLYQQKKLPLLPAGKASANFIPPTTTASPVISNVTPRSIFDRMTLIGKDSVEKSPKHNSSPKPFWIGKYEVTRGEWAAIWGLAPPPDPERAMDKISWDACQGFVQKLNEQSGANGPQFRLPTLDEWKFAAHADSSKAYVFGDGAGGLPTYGWFAAQGVTAPQKVGQLRPNQFGLFDLHGNVAEWCQDETELSMGARDKSSPSFRVVLGGGYLSSARQCKIASAGFARQNEIRRGIGLRLVAAENGAGSSVNQSLAVRTKEQPDRNLAGMSFAISDARAALETEVFQRHWLQDKLFTLLYLQACVRASMEDVDTAAANLRMLMREMPDDNSPLMHLARCHFAWIQCTRKSANAEQIAEARRIVETSLTRSEFKLWIGYLTQSVVLAAEGQFEDAARRATQASDLAPSQFKAMCAAQLKAIEGKRIAASSEFPVSPAVSPATVVGP